MSKKWPEAQISHAHKTMMDFKSQIRALQKNRDEQLKKLKEDDRYGGQYVETKSQEIRLEIMKKADALIGQANTLFENVRPQAVYYSAEYKSSHDRLVPVASLPEMSFSYRSPTEEILMSAVNEQLKLQSEIADDMRRSRVYQELAIVPPERFQAILDIAVADSDFATLGIAKQVASVRKEASIKSAVVSAETNIKLPEAESKIAGTLADIDKMAHQIASSYREIKYGEEDIAAKVEAVDLRQTASVQ